MDAAATSVRGKWTGLRAPYWPPALSASAQISAVDGSEMVSHASRRWLAAALEMHEAQSSEV